MSASDQARLINFVNALSAWVYADIKRGHFTPDEAGDLGASAATLRGLVPRVVEASNPDEREQAAQRLHRLLSATLHLGTALMTSNSAERFRTSPGRDGIAQKRRPREQALDLALAKAMSSTSKIPLKVLTRRVNNELDRCGHPMVSSKTVQRRKNRTA
jgi:hypothetical protein